MRFSALGLLVLGLAACGAADASTPPASPVQVVAATSASQATAPTSAATAPEPSSDPTEPTAAQRAREEPLVKRATAYVDAFRDTGALLTKDGAKVVFLSDRDGLPQLYVGDVAHPEAPPARLGTGSERVAWARLSPDEKSVLFLTDAGADENFRIQRVGLDSSGLVNLTPEGTLHRDAPFVPRGNPRTMVYAATSVSSPETRVFAQPADGGAARVVHTDGAPGGLADVTPDGKRALYERFVSNTEQVLFEIDLDAKTARRLYPAEGKKTRIDDAAYADGGKRALVATDDGGDTSVLLEVDPARASITRRKAWDDPPGSSIAALAFAPAGGRLAVMVNEGTRTTARILDAKTLAAAAKVDLPAGSAELGAFRADGRQLSVSVTSPKGPFEVYAVDVATGAARPLRRETRPELAPMNGTSLTIPAHDGGKIPVNVYLPARTDRKLPTIVLVHGGPSTNAVSGWGPCLAAGPGLLCRPYAPFFVSLGFAIVEPNIRGSTGYGRAYEMGDDREKRGDALRDVESVNAWAKAQPWADPARVVVFGSSYGGYMTLLALTRQPTLWAAGVDMFGPADLRAFLRTTDAGIRAAFVQEFGDLDADGPLLDAWSPIKKVDQVKAPLFVYQGQNDPRVPRPESDAMVKALRARGVPVEYMVAADEGHSLERRANRIVFMARAARFLSEQLGVTLD
jgi:dipeptidyl aminopeptidase/acylaminoacyl peptidase